MSTEPSRSAGPSAPDFRSVLYSRYVSTFKDEGEDLDASARDAFFSWCEATYLPLLSSLDRNRPVLEIGCGPGYFLEYLSREGFTDVEGIDVSAEQVALAQARGVKARVADVFESLASPQRRYQSILALDFVEHFSRDELLRLVPLLHDALEPDGLLVLQTPNGSGLFPAQVMYGDLTHLTILTDGSLRQLLRPFGFERFEFRETGPVSVGAKGRARALAWRMIRLLANVVRKIETGKTQSVWTENLICTSRRSA